MARRAARTAGKLSAVQGFLEEAKRNPDDDGPRLVLADWLMEHGQPERGKLVRLQVEAARLPRHDPRRLLAEGRVRDLQQVYGEEWLRPITEWLYEDWFTFNRGLLRCAIFTSWFLDHHEEIVRSEAYGWIDRLTLLDTTPELAQRLVALPDAGLPARVCFTPSGHPSEEGGALEDDGAATLASWPGLAKVTHLDLGGNHIGDAGVLALMESRHLSNLTSLKLPWTVYAINNLSVEGVRHLAESRRLAKLTEFDLSGTSLGTEGMRALVESRHLANLTELILQGCELEPRAVTLLADAPHLKRLQRLDLRNTHLGDRGLAASAHEGVLCLYDVATLKQRKMPTKPKPGWPTAVRFSADGRLLAACDSEQEFHVWDVASGRRLRSFTHRDGWVDGVAFAQQGQLAVSWSRYSQVWIWSLDGVGER